MHPLHCRQLERISVNHDTGFRALKNYNNSSLSTPCHLKHAEKILLLPNLVRFLYSRTNGLNTEDYKVLMDFVWLASTHRCKILFLYSQSVMLRRLKNSFCYSFCNSSDPICDCMYCPRSAPQEYISSKREAPYSKGNSAH